MSYHSRLYETFIAKGYWKMLLFGLKNTLVITIGAVLIGVFIGFFIAVSKYFLQKKNSWYCTCLRKFLDLYVTVIRGIPVVVLLMIFFFVVFKDARDGILVAILTFGINSGAYMSEIIRSGLDSVDSGQRQAGLSLGLSELQCMIKIIIPQAIKTIIPGVGNEFIALIKETSVAGYVAVVDLTRAGNMIKNNTYDSLNPLMAVALIYLFFVIVLTKLLSRLEKKVSYGKK